MWGLNSSELAWRKFKLITELESLGLFAYFVRTYVIGVDSSRLKKSATFLRVLAYIEWWRYV